MLKRRPKNKQQAIMLRGISNILIILVALILGILLARMWYMQPTSVTRTDANVMIEQIKNVSKIVNTEGYFSEVYTETDTKSFYGFPSTKKIIIKVKARVMAGYDLNNLKIDVDSSAKKIKVTGLNNPQIIGIEPEIQYYDVTNGVLNQFSAEDYSRLNQKAIDTIRYSALRSNLLNNVAKQGVSNFRSLQILAQQMGWRIEFDDASIKN